jgi:hypothetical protein
MDRRASKIAKARRQTALDRHEFRYPSDQRISADSPMSAALKAEDPELRKMIDEALARRS